MKMISSNDRKVISGNFSPSIAAEQEFYRALRKVASYAGHLIDAHIDDGKIKDGIKLNRLIQEYSKLIRPWAIRQSEKLLTVVERSNKRAYQNKSFALGVLFNEKSEKYIKDKTQSLLLEQVDLIQSIPIKAAERAQKIAFKAVLEGSRAVPDKATIDELKKSLNASTQVAISRAKLIAVTETARATAIISETRARAVGSDSYKWHNSGDGAVRKAHRVYKGKALQGRIFYWDNPPVLDDGTQGHPGTFPWCRCFAEPRFEDE